MTHTSVSVWSQDLQTKLMAALEAAWAIIETSDDAAIVRKARDKAKACGEFAAVVRKIAAMIPAKPQITPDSASDTPAVAAAAQVAPAQRALDRLKGRRGRI